MTMDRPDEPRCEDDPPNSMPERSVEDLHREIRSIKRRVAVVESQVAAIRSRAREIAC